MTSACSTSALAPLAPLDGYLPIEDFGLIGDGSTAALVGRDGTVAWLCVPRFDDEPLFCSILDRARGGGFRLAPEQTIEARQRYEPDSGVLVTDLRSPTGLVRITDCLTLRVGADLSEDVPAGRGELLRSVSVLDGHVRLEIEVDPRGGATCGRRADGLAVRPLRRPDVDLQLVSTVPLDGLRTAIEVRGGDRADLPGPPRRGARALRPALHPGRAAGPAARGDRPHVRLLLGNYPQALSHVGLISSGINLAKLDTPRRVR